MDARARSASGSSPLARGLRAEDHERPGRGGIIPARAGFTGPADRGPGRRLDHPRSRGVYTNVHAMTQQTLGSSPLARGLPWKHEGDFTEGGIIPARAGFTTRWPELSRGSRDHPRSRGVYSIRFNRTITPGGSSPLARGLPTVVVSEDGYAVDHPRSRGVYYWARIYISLSAGSSPLARGLHQMIRDRVTDGGIIPARAGFTLSVQ